MKKLGLDKRERKFVAGVVEGKPLIRAAKDAGYAKSTAEKKSFAILRRPLVQSELTKAMERHGLTMKRIVQPIVAGLTANLSMVVHGVMIESDFPDHHIRLAASDRAVKLLGGIPKVGESTPSASGLNLFISVDQQSPTVPAPPAR
jgi:hypothetical protein